MFGSGAEASDVAREARHNYLNAMGADASADGVGAAGPVGADASAAGADGVGADGAGNAVIDQRLAPRLLFKVVMAGESGVGKTSLLQSFCGRPFDARSDPTIGVDFCTRKLRVCLGRTSFNNTHAVNGLHFDASDERVLGAHGLEASPVVKLQVWDTAGHERFASLTQTYFRDAAGCLLVYDAASEPTAAALARWLERLRRGSPDACVVVVAGKCDALAAGGGREAAEGGLLLSAAEGLAHVCASGKSGLGVAGAFQALADLIFRERVFPRLASGEPLRLSASVAKLAVSSGGVGVGAAPAVAGTWSLGPGLFLYGANGVGAGVNDAGANDAGASGVGGGGDSAARFACGGGGGGGGKACSVG